MSVSVRTLAVGLALSALTLCMGGSQALAQGNANPKVLPPHSSPHGMTYGEWGAAWWSWALAEPIASNPLFDATGELGHVGQEGSVWFLAGTFGGSAEREITIPAGKSLFFPIINSAWWAPEDIAFAEFVAETYFGIDPDELTDEELLALTATFQVTFETLEMSVVVDGVPLQNLESYFAVSPGFDITDSDLLDELGIPISHPNMAVAAGYWVMLAPLSKGHHTVSFSVLGEGNPLFGSFALDVSYHITVKK